MRKSAGVLIAALCVVALGVPGIAKTETVTGQVIDLACYARNRANVGRDHDQGRECAWACVKWEGQPVGLLTADGKIYQLAGGLVANSNAKIAPHLAENVTVTGDVTEVDGLLTVSANDLTVAK